MTWQDREATTETGLTGIMKWRLENSVIREFPGGPLDRTRGFYWGGPGSIPGWGELRPRKTCGTALPRIPQNTMINLFRNLKYE